MPEVNSNLMGYTVVVSRTITYEVRLVVHADCTAAAEEKALNLAHLLPLDRWHEDAGDPQVERVFEEVPDA